MGKKAQVTSRETMRGPARVEGDKAEQAPGALNATISVSFSACLIPNATTAEIKSPGLNTVEILT